MVMFLYLWGCAAGPDTPEVPSDPVDALAALDDVRLGMSTAEIMGLTRAPDADNLKLKAEAFTRPAETSTAYLGKAVVMPKSRTYWVKDGKVVEMLARFDVGRHCDDMAEAMKAAGPPKSTEVDADLGMTTTFWEGPTTSFMVTTWSKGDAPCGWLVSLK